MFNQGTVEANNTVVTDHLPPGFTLNDDDWTDNADGTASISVASIAAGDSIDIPITLTVTSANIGDFENIAEISSDGGNDVDSTPNTDPGDDGTPVDDVTDNSGGDQDDHDPAPITIVPDIDLALIKQLDTDQTSLPVVNGQDVTFTITVVNQGDGPVEFIEVTDYVDTSMFEPFQAVDNQTGGFAAVSGGTSTNAFVYRWDGADPTAPRAEIRPAGLADAPVGNGAGAFSPDPSLWLYEGESIQITLTLRVADSLSSGITRLENRAEISAWDIDASTSNGSSQVPNASGAVLADVDSTADGTDESNGGETTAGALVDDEIGQSGLAGGDEDDHDPAIVPLADLALIKTRSADQPLSIDPAAVPAPTVSFDITVKNQGSVSLFDVQVVDPVPAGLGFVSAAGSQTASGVVGVAPVVSDLGALGGVATVEIDRIDPGEQVTFDVVFVVTDPAATVFVNTAVVGPSTCTAPPFSAALLERKRVRSVVSQL